MEHQVIVNVDLETFFFWNSSSMWSTRVHGIRVPFIFFQGTRVHGTQVLYMELEFHELEFQNFLFYFILIFWFAITRLSKNRVLNLWETAPPARFIELLGQTQVNGWSCVIASQNGGSTSYISPLRLRVLQWSRHLFNYWKKIRKP